MARRPAFIDVLDDMLSERLSGATERSRTPARSVATAALGGYPPYLKPNRFWTSPGPYASTTARHTEELLETPTPDVVVAAVPDAVETSPRAERLAEPIEHRAPRVLKPAEDTALNTLVRLGASLDRAFTARELRSAFRELAHRYHPDRHPHASDNERLRLGATFAELTSAYGVLLSSDQN